MERPRIIDNSSQTPTENGTYVDAHEPAHSQQTSAKPLRNQKPVSQAERLAKSSRENEKRIARIEDVDLRMKCSRLNAKFQRDIQVLSNQLKLARGFDRQKMTRRVKQADDKGSQADQTRLSDEIKVLTDFQAEKTAREWIIKQGSKMKRVREDEAWEFLYGNEKAIGVKTTAEANVLGRLFKTQCVLDVTKDMMSGIRAVLGLDGAAPASKPVRKPADEFTAQSRNDDFSGFSDDEKRKDQIDHTSERLIGEESLQPNDDDLMDIYADRLAGDSDSESRSSNDEDRDHDGSTENTEVEELDAMSITSEEDIDIDEDSASVTDNTDLEVSDQNPTKLRRPQIEPSKPTSTSFLPSLTMGGYYSASDSDSDQEIEALDHLGRPLQPGSRPQSTQRKNRRGQRERQQIAEKKFGSKAKHLARQQGNVNSERAGLIARATAERDGGKPDWDAKRGAVERDARGRVQRERKTGSEMKVMNRKQRREMLRRGSKGGRSIGIGSGKAGGGTGANDGALRFNRLDAGSNGANGTTNSGNADKKDMNGEKLKASTATGTNHPSWEAARRKKAESAKISAAMSGGAGVGKKITFD